VTELRILSLRTLVDPKKKNQAWELRRKVG
jgi:hypothetical protein